MRRDDQRGAPSHCACGGDGTSNRGVDAQQLRAAFPWDEAPRYVLHDRDHAFDGWADTAKAMGMDDLLTAPRSPWQNADVERFIGSARRECLDHVIVCSATGL